jgi:hypothetical protein
MAHAAELGLSRPDAGVAQSLLAASGPTNVAPDATHVAQGDSTGNSQDDSIDLSLYLAPSEPPRISSF